MNNKNNGGAAFPIKTGYRLKQGGVMGKSKGYYNRITICRSCGDVIRIEPIPSDSRIKPIYGIMPPEFCGACKKVIAREEELCLGH